MKKFPITIVDDFYENPGLVRNFALSLEYYESDGRWPGLRSDLISKLNPTLFETFNSKIFSLFYDFDTSKLEWEVNTIFQKIKSFSNVKDNIKNNGWIHKDECLLSGVIYLNPNPQPNSGTSIYSLREGHVDDCPQITKNLHYSNSSEFDELEYKKEKTYNNGKFIETIKIENVYNRMILFERGIFHGVPSYYCESNEPRLTQVFFVEYLNASSLFPIIRSRSSYP